MAGSHSRPPIVAAEQSALPSSMSIATVTNHWEVQYARFILCPASPNSSHSSLISLSSIGRKYGKSGRWISSASLVYLKLRTNSFDPNGGFILVVSLRERILVSTFNSLTITPNWLICLSAEFLKDEVEIENIWFQCYFLLFVNFVCKFCFNLMWLWIYSLNLVWIDWYSDFMIWSHSHYFILVLTLRS